MRLPETMRVGVHSQVLAASRAVGVTGQRILMPGRYEVSEQMLQVGDEGGMGGVCWWRVEEGEWSG